MNTLSTVYYLMAFGAGLGVTLQTTVNGHLAKGMGGDSVTAAFFSFALGAFLLGMFSVIRGGTISSLVAIPTQPLWSLTGGLLGACALLSYVVLAPKIGLSALLGLAIAGQLISSGVIDHFALMGMTARPISVVKLCGLLIMLGGLVITLFGDRWAKSIFG